jgi:hypothetical protein
LIDRFQYPADFAIEVFQHRNISYGIRVVPVGFGDDLFLILRPLVRQMRAFMGHIQKERSGFVLFDEGDGVVGDQMRHIALAVHRQSAAKQHVQIAGLAMREVMHVASQIARELVPAVLDGVEVRFVTQMPFAEQPARVAGFLQSAGQHGLRRRKPELPLLGEPDGIVIAADVASADGAFQPARALLIPSCEKRGSRRAAFGAIGIMLREPRPFRREPIQMRRLRRGMPITT